MNDQFDFEVRLHQIPWTLAELQDYFAEYGNYSFSYWDSWRIEREFAHKYFILTDLIYSSGDLDSGDYFTISVNIETLDSTNITIDKTLI